jgi:hypothetical protein
LNFVDYCGNKHTIESSDTLNCQNKQTKIAAALGSSKRVACELLTCLASVGYERKVMLVF